MLESGHSWRSEAALITLCLLAYGFAATVNAQVTPPAKKQTTKTAKPAAKTEEANPLAL